MWGIWLTDVRVQCLSPMEGNERKGKERKGKERKEKERKGKGRKGKGRKEKEVKGKGRKRKERKGKGRKERKGKELDKSLRSCAITYAGQTCMQCHSCSVGSL